MFAIVVFFFHIMTNSPILQFCTLFPFFCPPFSDIPPLPQRFFFLICMWISTLHPRYHELITPSPHQIFPYHNPTTTAPKAPKSPISQEFPPRAIIAAPVDVEEAEAVKEAAVPLVAVEAAVVLAVPLLPVPVAEGAADVAVDDAWAPTVMP